MPDSRLDILSQLSKSQKTVPTSVEFVDIAGLVKGASQGEVRVFCTTIPSGPCFSSAVCSLILSTAIEIEFFCGSRGSATSSYRISEKLIA